MEARQDDKGARGTDDEKSSRPMTKASGEEEIGARACSLYIHVKDILFQLFFGRFENTLYLRKRKTKMKLMKKSILFLMMLLAAATVSAQDLVDRVSQAVGVELPSEYRQKVKDFVANDTIMRTRSATQFTEEFLKEQMKEDWGISKKHQYLFMWSTVYEEITKKFLYDWLDDDDEVRSNDYENHLKTLIAFRENYKKEFKAYMERKSAEADRRSAEADRKSAEADRRSAEARLQSAEAAQTGLKNLIELYNLYKTDSSIVHQEEFEEVKNHSKWIFQRCKELNIDYQAFLRKELRNEQKVKDLLKFYGVE